MAQAYNHTILPLDTYHDKVTQVTWGIADFQHRFGRRPEGMWLPETAVDLETLDLMAEQGIAFTILAPRQAARDIHQRCDRAIGLTLGEVRPVVRSRFGRRAFRECRLSGRSTRSAGRRSLAFSRGGFCLAAR